MHISIAKKMPLTMIIYGISQMENVIMRGGVGMVLGRFFNQTNNTKFTTMIIYV